MKLHVHSFRKLAYTFIFAFISVSQLMAQQQDLLKSNDVIKQHAAAIGFSDDDLKNYRISDAYVDKSSGATIYYLQQTYKGIDVLNAIQTVAIKNDKVVSLAGKRIAKIEFRVDVKSGIPSVTADDAVKAAARHLNLSAPAFIKAIKNMDETKLVRYDNLGISSVPVKSRLIWFVDSKLKKVTLSWQVEVQPIGRKDYWLVHVDASKNDVINKMNLNVNCAWNDVKNTGKNTTSQSYYNNIAGQDAAGIKAITSASYRVIPFPNESPLVVNPTLVSNPWELAGSNNNATTLKWNDNGTTTFDSSKGNNVLAQEDVNGNNGFGKGANSTTAIPNLTFNFQPDFTKSPLDSTNQKFAITNLFYWNNIMHDVSYQYGFDEISGNFQSNNLSRGGIGNDYVFADAQDGSGSNNANFATPADGGNPRMQMFLFTSSSSVFNINSPQSIAGNKFSVEGALSTQNKIANVGPVTGNMALYNDDVAGTRHSACIAAANAPVINGKIALLKRGGCAFMIKVKNAQNAGAIAVIVMDSIPGESPFIMSGDDNTITIPAFMISYEDGLAIMNTLTGGTTVNATLAAGQNKDGDLDNGVIAHEYTHGISNRLTGGPSQASCLQDKEQMGEGWSDYLALMVTTNWKTATLNDGAKPHPIGNYVEGYPVNGPGIRAYPYSTNMSINPWTYADLKTLPKDANEPNSPEPHYVGEIWCATLWDMTWNIIQQDATINTNLYNANGPGGNSAALKLVMEGLKLQPCGPGFIDGRDAILKADTLLFGGKYSCSIWKAFSGRGMGAFASEGNPDVWGDETPDFNYARVTKTADKDSAAQGEQITYTFKVTTDHCVGISNYKIVDTLKSNVTYVSSNGTYNSGNRTVTFSGITLAPNATASYSLVVKVNNGTYAAPVTYLKETVPSLTIASTWVTSSTTSDTWVVSDSSHSSPYSFYINDDPNAAVLAKLSTAKAYKIGDNTKLSFWHYYNTEESWDGGWVEISTNNGVTYTDLGPYILQNGYTNNINYSGSNLKLGFSGSNNGFKQTIIDLSSFAGDSVKFRFVFSADDNTGVDGWYVDDILLQNTSGTNNIGRLFNSGGTLQNASTARTAIKDKVLAAIWGDFSATKVNNSSLLKWQTETETNTSKFVIERSADGINFQQLGSVQAAGNSSVTKNYQFTDQLPLNGKDYYRITQVDKDGSSIYSAVRTLDFLLNRTIAITPNPAKGFINVTVSGNDKALKVSLVSATGQLIKRYDMTGESQQFNLPAIAPGVYYIKINGDDVNSTHKLIVQ